MRSLPWEEACKRARWCCMWCSMGLGFLTLEDSIDFCVLSGLSDALRLVPCAHKGWRCAVFLRAHVFDQCSVDFGAKRRASYFFFLLHICARDFFFGMSYQLKKTASRGFVKNECHGQSCSGSADACTESLDRQPVQTRPYSCVGCSSVFLHVSHLLLQPWWLLLSSCCLHPPSLSHALALSYTHTYSHVCALAYRFASSSSELVKIERKDGIAIVSLNRNTLYMYNVHIYI